MALTSTQRKQEQRRRDKAKGIKRLEVRIVNNIQAEAELYIALAKINKKHSNNS